jgi:hypothetical protein
MHKARTRTENVIGIRAREYERFTARGRLLSSQRALYLQQNRSCIRLTAIDRNDIPRDNYKA